MLPASPIAFVSKQKVGEPMGYRVYVTTSDKYLLALRPFAFLFNRFWSPDVEVVVGGFTPPDFSLPSNFRFVVLGRMEDYPIDKWSDALIRMLNFLDDEICAIMLEDYWLCRPVDLNAVKIAHQYMKQFKNVIRFDLTADRKYAGDIEEYGRAGDLELLKSPPGSPYHMSLMCALWRKELLLKILEPDESPWDIEIQGTTRLSAMGDDYLVLGTKNVPVKHTLAFRGGDNSELLLDEIGEDIVQEMRELGLLEGLE